MIKYINKKSLFITVILMFCIFIPGCSSLNSLQVKVGLKNSDFDYINQGKVKRIIIESTRDQGFRFVVTDQKAITELYDILSSAKQAKQKSNLKPDYIFEIDETNNKVHKFNYIVGLDKKDYGNLYNNNNVYIVSNRIDNDIITNFWNIRTPPNDFKSIYYGSVKNALDEYFKNKDKNKTIGINFDDDVDAARFILSTELADFTSDISSKFKNSSIVNHDKDKYDILVTVKTEGYKSTLYKLTVTFWDKSQQNEKKYYIINSYKNTRWDTTISENKPDTF